MDEAIRRFIAEDYRRIVGALALITGSVGTAEDVVQEALAKAWERSDRGGHIDSLPAWVTTVATNLARSKLRRLRAERSALDRLPLRQRPGQDLDELLDLRRAVSRLPRRQREVTVLHYYLDLPVAEIAKTLGITEGAAKNALFLSRQSLAVALGLEEEVDPEEEVKDVTPGR